MKEEGVYTVTLMSFMGIWEYSDPSRSPSQGCGLGACSLTFFLQE